MEDRITGEVAECYRLHLTTDDLRRDGETHLLTGALNERIQRSLDLVFSFLQARYPGHDLARAQAAATSADDAGKALVAELLDSMVDRRVGELLLPLFEAPAERLSTIAAEQFGIAHRSSVDRIAELCENKDPWLRACAAFAIGQRPDPRLTPLALAALGDEDDLVRESALAACRRFLPPERFATAALEQVQASSFPVTLRYARTILTEAGAA